MSSDNSWTRRRLLGVAGVAATGSVAGCTGSDRESSSDSDHDHDGSHDGEESHDEEETEHSEDAEGHHDAPTEPVERATVTMRTEDDGHHFSPHVVWIESGGSVTFETESGQHTTTAYHADNDRPTRMPEAGESWDSGLLAEDEQFARSFETEGVYDYYCEPHEGEGMIGSIIVGRPDADSDPGLAAPQDEFDDRIAEKLSSLNETARSALDDHREH